MKAYNDAQAAETTAYNNWQTLNSTYNTDSTNAAAAVRSAQSEVNTAKADLKNAQDASFGYKQDVTTGNASYVNEDGTKNETSYVSAGKVSDTLSSGTDVTIEARDANKVASIEVDAAITMDSESAAAKAVKGNDNTATLALKAQRNVTINKEIKAVNDSKLNVLLQSDLDGDNFGAVVVNANINTNGGSFTSASGTTATSSTVGTYFGHADGETTENRTITTNGGDINLYGDVALGLNGASLTLNTVKANDATKGGAVTITGSVDSGNSYKAYTNNSSDSKDWYAMVKDYYNNNLKGTSDYIKDSKTAYSKEDADYYEGQGYTVTEKNW